LQAATKSPLPASSSFMKFAVGFLASFKLHPLCFMSYGSSIVELLLQLPEICKLQQKGRVYAVSMLTQNM
jgi:hypothetical protein